MALDPHIAADVYRDALRDLAGDVAQFLNDTADPTDDAVARKAAALADAYRGAMTPFRQAILDSTSPEDAIARVSALYRDWSPTRVIVAVNEALELAAAAGAVRAKPA